MEGGGQVIAVVSKLVQVHVVVVVVFVLVVVVVVIVAVESLPRVEAVDPLCMPKGFPSPSLGIFFPLCVFG